MTWRWPLAALVAMVVPASALAQGSSPAVRVALILEASGDVEISRGADAPWTPVRTGQELIATDAVRTRSSAFARIKFEAGLLWVLRAVSHMELRAAVAGAANTNTIRVRLESGKAVATWTPDRQTATGKAAGAVARAVVETPSGQAAIQGTEWSLNVEDDGRTALVVLTGSVELSNALGAVTVGANEAAEMRVGQAPTLLRIVNPRDRVQWVADYAAQPLRYADAAIGSARADFDLSVADAAAGRPAAAIERLARLTAAGAAPPGVTLALADLLIAAGELERARVQLEAARTQQPADARFDALLSRIALFEGRTADSRALANQATTKEPNTVDGWLALGESAQSDGDGPIARQAFQQATAVAPDDARGWYGRGSVETDYEAFVPARRWLTRALTLDPKGPGYRGEMGTVETLANNFSAAKREFAQALTDRRDDYVALTGRALLALKEGREPEALDLLLRATLIEPNYARAQVYLGVTYYRLRRHDDAIRALHKASRLDPKDPLPYLMVSAIHTDLYAPSEAIVAARQARDLMPNLKSLNQLASTQKGTANLGNSVSFFGLEQWAQHLAQESYYPFWAGSHLFLGDRYESAYARTSEYYQGLLADPTVFGGSPTFQTLLPRAGSHATGTLSVSRDAGVLYGGESSVSVNGYANRSMPIGYAVNAQGGVSAAARSVVEAEGIEAHVPVSASAAIGLAPSPRWSVFATAAQTRQRDGFLLDFGTEGSEVVQWAHAGNRFDAGANFRPSPDSALTMRVGLGSATADLPSGSFIPKLAFDSTPAEVQARYTHLRAGRHEMSAGFDISSDRQRVAYVYLKVPGTLRNDLSSRHAFVSARSSWGAAIIEADVFLSREDVGAMRPPGNPVNDLKAVTSVQPRVGASVWIGSGVLRAAFQQRTRPWAALSTLGPVATAGVALDDTLVQPGGDQQRARLQLDWEWSSRTFTTVFADTQRVDNSLSVHSLESLLGLLQKVFEQSASTAEARYAEALSDLRDIARDASRLNVATQSLLEGAANVGSGRATTMGVAVNRVLTRQLSVASHYRHANSSGVTTFFLMADESSRGQDLAFLPRHVLSLATTWVSPRRIYLSGEALYRSSRFESSYRRAGETLVRRERLADWTARLTGSWESRNKRWVIEFAATDLLAKSHSASYQLTAKVRR